MWHSLVSMPLSFQCGSRFNAGPFIWFHLAWLRFRTQASCDAAGRKATTRCWLQLRCVRANPRGLRDCRGCPASCTSAAGTRAGCVRHGCVKASESAGDPPLGLGSLGRAVQMSRRTICRRFARRFDNAQAPASGRSGSWICGQPEQRLLPSVTDLSTIHKQ